MEFVIRDTCKFHLLLMTLDNLFLIHFLKHFETVGLEICIKRTQKPPSMTHTYANVLSKQNN